MDFKQIRLERDGNVAILTLNRPEVLNALAERTLDELRQAVCRIAGSPELRAVVVTGAGDRAFSAGADLDATRALRTARDVFERSLKGQDVFRLIEELPKPVIMAINGVAFGGGCELALAGDIRIAASTARIGLTEVKLGLIPGWGGTQRLPRLVGQPAARWLILSGEPVSAEEALRLGLVQRVVPPAELLPAALDMARTLAGRPAVAVAMAKQCLNAAASVSLAEGGRFEAAAISALWDSQDREEGVAAFLEKRPPVFQHR